MEESGLVAEAVDDTELQTTSNALREKNRENEALRRELQRTREEQASQSRRRGTPLFWGKVCLGSLILIGAIVWGVIVVAGGSGGDEAASPAIVNPAESSSNPTAQATTAGPDVQTVFDPPSLGVCSKISEGHVVDGQEKMSIQPLTIKMIVYLLVDIRSELWLPDMLHKVQQLVMPSIAGCGDTTLDVFTVGNAQVDQTNATLISCEDKTNGACYTAEFPVNLFMKHDVVSYDLMELNQLVEGVFEISTSLLVDSENDISKAIKDIGSVTSVPVTPSPSQQPSSTLILTGTPSMLPSLEPSIALRSGATASPTTLLTPGPTASPITLSTPGPTLTPSLRPTMFPTAGPTLTPAAGPTIQPTSLPTREPTAPPSPLPTREPTAPPSPLPTPRPTIRPTTDPSDFPSPAPSPTPSRQPSAAPTSGPSSSRAPSPTPSQQPSTAPTSKCTRLEVTLSRFSPFDGNKGQALEWLCSNDVWEPPVDAADETSQSLWEERFTLVTFYYATAGDGWRNNDGWLTPASVCSWHGIDDCNGDGSVMKFQLGDERGYNYGLVGDFPDEMQALSNVEHLYFGYNKDLSGTIPSFIPALTKLTLLNLVVSTTTGYEPIASLPSADTGRTGSIPSELWTLTKLQLLGLWGNYLTGTIPSGIGALTELTLMGIAFNDLTGSLPDEFGGMTQLTRIGLSENFLNGAIPPLPSSLVLCRLAYEEPRVRHYTSRKTEGNCFTNTTNAGLCDISKNCP